MTGRSAAPGSGCRSLSFPSSAQQIISGVVGSRSAGKGIRRLPVYDHENRGLILRSESSSTSRLTTSPNVRLGSVFG